MTALSPEELRRRAAVIARCTRTEAARELKLSPAGLRRTMKLLDADKRHDPATHKRQRPLLSPAAASFVATWNACETLAQVAAETGLDPAWCSVKASRLRKRNVELKLFSRGVK